MFACFLVYINVESIVLGNIYPHLHTVKDLRQDFIGRFGFIWYTIHILRVDDSVSSTIQKKIFDTQNNGSDFVLGN